MFEKSFLQSVRPNLQKAFFKHALAPFRHIPSILFLNLIRSNSAKDRPQEDITSIFVAWEQRLDASAKASIQPAATKVTNMEVISSWGRLLLIKKLNQTSKVCKVPSLWSRKCAKCTL